MPLLRIKKATFVKYVAKQAPRINLFLLQMAALVTAVIAISEWPAHGRALWCSHSKDKKQRTERECGICSNLSEVKDSPSAMGGNDKQTTSAYTQSYSRKRIEYADSLQRREGQLTWQLIRFVTLKPTRLDTALNRVIRRVPA
jgi:hypothetical protein